MKLLPDERQDCGCLVGQPCDCEMKLHWVISYESKTGLFELDDDEMERCFPNGYIHSSTLADYFFPGGDNSPAAMDVDDEASQKLFSALDGVNMKEMLKRRRGEIKKTEAYTAIQARHDQLLEVLVTQPDLDPKQRETVLGAVTGLVFALDQLKRTQA